MRASSCAIVLLRQATRVMLSRSNIEPSAVSTASSQVRLVFVLFALAIIFFASFYYLSDDILYFGSSFRIIQIARPNQESNHQNETVFDLDRFRLNPITRAYEIDGKPILWQYWHDSKNIPLVVRVWLEAMQCRNPEFRVIVVHDSTVQHYLSKSNIPWDRFMRRLSGNHKADIFRVHIMYEYGGAYADADTLPLDKLIAWYRQLDEYDFVTHSWGDEITTMSCFGPVRAKSRIFEIWSKYQQKKLLEKEYCCYDFGVFGPTGIKNALLEEVRNNRTKCKGYPAGNAVGQLMRGEWKKSLLAPFAEYEKKHGIIPLYPTPYLYLHLSQFRTLLFSHSDFEKLMPTENMTVFSAFAGCALLDCWSKYEYIVENNLPSTGWLDAAKASKFLKNIDQEVCEKLKERKPLDDQ